MNNTLEVYILGTNKIIRGRLLIPILESLMLLIAMIILPMLAGAQTGRRQSSRSALLQLVSLAHRCHRRNRSTLMSL